MSACSEGVVLPVQSTHQHLSACQDLVRNAEPQPRLGPTDLQQRGEQSPDTWVDGYLRRSLTHSRPTSLLFPLPYHLSCVGDLPTGHVGHENQPRFCGDPEPLGAYLRFALSGIPLGPGPLSTPAPQRDVSPDAFPAISSELG